MTWRAQFAFVFILTHPAMQPVGAMRATLDSLAFEFKEDREAFREAFREVITQGLIEASDCDCFLWVPNFLKYNQPESVNVVKSWSGCWDVLPECELKMRLFLRLEATFKAKGKAYAKAFDMAFAKPSAKAYTFPSLNQEQEQEQYKREIGRDENSASNLLESPPMAQLQSRIDRALSSSELSEFARLCQLLDSHPVEVDGVEQDAQATLARCVQAVKLDAGRPVKYLAGIVDGVRNSGRWPGDRSRQDDDGNATDRAAELMAELEERDREREAQNAK